MSAVFSGYSPGILQKHAWPFSSILSCIKVFTRSRSYRNWRQNSCKIFRGQTYCIDARVTRKWRPTVKNRRSLDRKRFSPENCLKRTKGDFKWKKFENFARSTSMWAYSAQNAPPQNSYCTVHQNDHTWGTYLLSGHLRWTWILEALWTLDLACCRSEFDGSWILFVSTDKSLKTPK